MEALIVFSSIVMIVFFIFVAPIWIFFNYLAKTKTANQLTDSEEKLINDLWQMASAIEKRVEHLEVILKEDNKKENE